MIDLYTWSTPNGRKVSIALEEMALAYRVHPIDIGKGEQFAPHFLKIAPNNRIPAIIDQDTGMSLFESGAILLHLAEKAGRFWLQDASTKWRVVEWLMWQMGGFGPMLGQANHFLKFNRGKSSYAEERYGKEARRLFGVLDRRLAEHEFVAGDYSIADMAIWPWSTRFVWYSLDLDEVPNVKRWYLAIAARPAVQRGFLVPDPAAKIPLPE
jgi:GST-like protein